MVVTIAPSAWATGMAQDCAAVPSRCTVQTPQTPMPQPYFVPVRLSSSRRTQSNGVSGADTMLWTIPLTERFMHVSSLVLCPVIPAAAGGWRRGCTGRCQAAGVAAHRSVDVALAAHGLRPQQGAGGHQLAALAIARLRCRARRDVSTETLHAGDRAVTANKAARAVAVSARGSRRARAKAVVDHSP